MTNPSYKPAPRLMGKVDDLLGWQKMMAHERNVDWHLRRSTPLSGLKFMRIRYRYPKFGDDYLTLFGTVDEIIEKLVNESIRMVWYEIRELDVSKIEDIKNPECFLKEDPWIFVTEWNDSPFNYKIDEDDEDIEKFLPEESYDPVVSDMEI